MSKENESEKMLELLGGSLLLPFIFGFIGIPFTNDFSGAGIGAIGMIFIWVFIIVYTTLDMIEENKNG
jgi:hypothetical protein